MRSKAETNCLKHVKEMDDSVLIYNIILNLFGGLSSSTLCQVIIIYITDVYLLNYQKNFCNFSLRKWNNSDFGIAKFSLQSDQYNDTFALPAPSTYPPNL